MPLSINWVEICVTGFGIIAIPIIAVLLNWHLRKKEQRRMLERTLSSLLDQLSDELRATTGAFQHIMNNKKVSMLGGDIDDAKKTENFIEAVNDTTANFSVQVNNAYWPTYKTAFNDYIGFEFEEDDCEFRKQVLSAARELVQTVCGFANLQAATTFGDDEKAKRIVNGKRGVPGGYITPRDALKREIDKTQRNIAILLQPNSKILHDHLDQFNDWCEWARTSTGSE